MFGDDRGFFYESFNKEEFKQLEIEYNFIQDNHSRSSKGVLRGLHFQTENIQSKLIRVIKGEVYDVAVDLRKGSPYYGQSFGTYLSEENKLMLLIPKCFAHGFLTVSDDAELVYKVDDVYNKDADSGIKWDDPELDINWPLKEFNIDKPILSEKDSKLQYLSEFDNNFNY